MSHFELLNYDRLDVMVDMDPIALRSYAWAATCEVKRATCEVESVRAELAQQQAIVSGLTETIARLDAENAELAGENQTLTEQLAAATLEGQ